MWIMKWHTGSMKMIDCLSVSQIASTDVLALARVPPLRSVLLSNLKAYWALTPTAPQLLLVRAWGPSVFSLPFPISFHPSCPSAFCSLARTVIKPSACGHSLHPPPPTQKATNRLNYERNEGLKEKEANGVWETVIKNVALYADRTQV